MKTSKLLLLGTLLLALCIPLPVHALTHGVGLAKGTDPSLVDIGDPYYSVFDISNNDQAGDTVIIKSVIDVIAAAGGDISSGNIIEVVTWTFNGGASQDGGTGYISLPAGASVDNAANPYSFHNITPADFLLANPHYLFDTVTVVWDDTCNGTPDAGCIVGLNRNANAVAQVLIAPPEPDLCIDKTVDFDRDGVFTDLETNAPGEDADWAIVVTNCGDSTITDIYVSDDNLGVDFYGPFDLESGESEVIPIYTTNPLVDTLNTACADGIDILGAPIGPVCDAAEVIVECPQPCINITKTVDCSVSKVGDTVTYTICVENCGNAELTDVVVTDTLLGPITFPTTIAGGATVCTSVPYTILQSDDPGSTPGNTVVNVASVSAIDGCDGETPISDDSEEVSVLLVHPCLDVVVECISDGPVVPGGEATFRVTLNNCGDVDLLVDVTTDLGICESVEPVSVPVVGVAPSCVSSVLVPLDFVGTEICLTVTADWDIADDLDGCLPNEGTVVETGCCALTGDTFCSFTQGFWGNAGGTKCDGQTTSELIAAALAANGGSITVGIPPRSITFDSVACILASLPAGGTPSALPAVGGPWTCADLSSFYKNKKKTEINNVLVGQAVALQLNLLTSDNCLGEDSYDLGAWMLPDEFCVVPYDDPDACPKQYTIPASLVGKTVQELLDAVNAALAGSGDISDAYAGATAINEGFDECATVVDCGLEIEICENGCDDDYDGVVDEGDCVILE